MENLFNFSTDEAPMKKEGNYICPYHAKRCKVTIESPDLRLLRRKIESKTIFHYTMPQLPHLYFSVKVISAKELKKNARLIAAVNKKLSKDTWY